MIPAVSIWLLLAQAGGGVLTLDQALSAAREGNWDLRAAQARLAQAREASRKAWSFYLPQLGASGGYTLNSVEAKFGLPTGYYIRDVGQPTSPPFDPTQEVSPQNPPGRPTTEILFPSGFQEAVIQRRHQHGAQAQLSQALIAPPLFAAIHNAYLAEEVAVLTVESARREVLFAVAQLYFGAVGVREAIAVHGRLLEGTAAHEKDAQVRYDAGAVPKVALLKAQMDRARRAGPAAGQNAYASARARWRPCWVARTTSVQRPAEPPSPSASGEPEMAPGQAARPDGRQSRARARRAWPPGVAEVRPRAGAHCQYRLGNVKGFTGRYDTWAMMAGLSWTLWDEGAQGERAARGGGQGCGGPRVGGVGAGEVAR